MGTRGGGGVTRAATVVECGGEGGGGRVARGRVFVNNTGTIRGTPVAGTKGGWSGQSQ